MDLGFIGNISASIDGKGRVAIPAKYRKRLSDIDGDAGKVIVTLSESDKCLRLYPICEWAPVREQLSRLPTLDDRNRLLKQRLLGGATDLELDSNGRILLPSQHRKHADLDKQVLFVGNDQKLELWNEAAWQAQMERAEKYSLEGGELEASSSLEREQLVL